MFFPFVSAGAGDSSVNAVDPNFDPPSNWKFALGGVWEWGDFGWGSPFTFTGDLIYSISEDSAIIIDDTYVQIGNAHDGRPIYFPTDKSIPGCAQDPLSDPPGCDRLFTGDYILSNVQGDDAEQFSVSISASQEYDWGLDWLIAYAYTDSDEVHPMTSSVAFSNYFNFSTADPNNPRLATSNYETEHRFVVRLGFERAFFGDYMTRFNLFGERRSGRPFSFTMDQDIFVRGPFFNPDDDRSLLYVPTGATDPNVVFGPNFDQQAFFEYVNASGLGKYAGGIAPRNAFSSPYWTTVDLRISQEIPGFGDNHYAQAFLIIENLTNLLNDDWGVYSDQGFPYNRAIVSATSTDAGTPNDFSDDPYVYENFFPLNVSRVTSPSLWAIRLGVSYNF